jgi:predicted dehydrogenase
MNRKLRFGMIGGGRGAFIGAVHRIAAQMDGKAELVAGAFSSDPARSKASGADLFLNPARVYGSYEAMAKAESKLPADERLDFIVIVTPNHQHFPPAKLFLEAGFNVICDKPATFSLAEAKKLRAIVQRTKRFSSSRTTTPATPWSSRRVTWCVPASSATSEKSSPSIPRAG